VYAGTFDPFTNGHLDIAQRGALLFDQLIIAVYGPTSKSAIFSTEERVQMVREATADIPNVRIDVFDGLVVNYLKSVGAKVILRGLRAVSDFEYEFQMAHMNRQLWPEAEVICLITGKNHSFISATLIREIASLQADLTDLVPANVARALKKKYSA
jgi:pantetheine-phosphate adenylyltransferase